MKSIDLSLSLLAILITILSLNSVSAYQAVVSDEDALRQTCSGMWADLKKDTRVERE